MLVYCSSADCSIRFSQDRQSCPVCDTPVPWIPLTPEILPELPLNLASKDIWRDGRYLVADAQDASFPLRCVRTNRDVADYTVCRVQLVSWITWSAVFIAVCVRWLIVVAELLVRMISKDAAPPLDDGLLLLEAVIPYPIVLIAILIYIFSRGRIIVLKIGLEERISRRLNRCRVCGWLLMATGLIALFGVSVFEFVAAMKGVVYSDVSVLVIQWSPIVVTFLGLLIIYAGRPVLRGKKTEKNRVYLAGAHPKFLASLPGPSGLARLDRAPRSDIEDTPDFSGIVESEEPKW